MNKEDKKISDEAADMISEWKDSRPDLKEKQDRFLEKRKQKGTYIKFPDELKVALQILAGKKHMGYQTYLKSVLADHVEGEKNLGNISKDDLDIAMVEAANS